MKPIKSTPNESTPVNSAIASSRQNRAYHTTFYKYSTGRWYKSEVGVSNIAGTGARGAGLTCGLAHDGRREAHEHVDGAVRHLHGALCRLQLHFVFSLVARALRHIQPLKYAASILKMQ